MWRSGQAVGIGSATDIARTAKGVGVEAIFWTGALSIDDILRGADKVAFDMLLVIGQEAKGSLAFRSEWKHLRDVNLRHAQRYDKGDEKDVSGNHLGLVPDED